MPDLVVSPGLVDTHVHVNEPGRTEWEGFDTATRAAAAGGVTTLVDMPLNSVPATTDVAALDAKVDAARAQCHVDVGFWGGVVPGNAGELDALVDAGVARLQVLPRAVRRRRVPGGRRTTICARRCRSSRGATSRCSCTPSCIRRCSVQPAAIRRYPHYAAYLASRRAAMELEAIRLMIRLAAEFKARVHIVHVSSARRRRGDRGARKAAWVPITAETCPHYLTFAADEIPDGATAVQVRAADSRRGASRGAVGRAGERRARPDRHRSFAGAAALKTPGDFSRAWGGIASLELSLPAVWTAYIARCAQHRSHDAAPDAAPHLADLARWMSAAPAALAGLGERKGADRRGPRRRSGRLGSGRGVRRRSGAAAAAAQADAVRRAVAVRARSSRPSCAASACGTRTGSRAPTAARLL